MTDLRGADSLLQKAIEKVEDGKKLDTAQVIRRTGGRARETFEDDCAAGCGPGQTFIVVFLFFCDCCRKSSNALRSRGRR